MKKLEKGQGGETMEMKGSYVLIAFLVALVVCVVAIYATVPEVIHLEDSERKSFETQLQTKDDVYNAREAEWQALSEEWQDYDVSIRADEKNKCDLEKAKTAKRVAENNRELIRINDDWQELYEDTNSILHDVNDAIADLNCWR